MTATFVAITVFFGVLAVLVLAWRSGLTLRQAASLELARRLGPRDVSPSLSTAPEMDALGQWLGAPGAWLHRLTTRAGSRLTVTGMLGLVGLFAVIGAGVLYLVRPTPVAAVGALLGVAPVLWIRRQARLRSRLVTEQLPDAFDLIARALRSGHAFPEALRLAAAELPSPIRDELGPTAEQHRLGIDLRHCLDDLVRRVPDNFAVRLFASSVLLHRDTGGNLIEILEGLADTVRERVVFEEKVLALTAEVRTSATILEVLPFLAAGAILFTSPGYLNPLVEPGLGLWLLAGGATMMVVGILLIRNIARVQS